ncbi:hypothetical protein C8F01DRAFT_1366280 [Mycena amicta]|nr:hypothetical protein C8F01DRAFT_1366280 [Mycena amicta]
MLTARRVPIPHSLATMSASNSTTSLVSSSPTLSAAAPQKDFQSAFALLQTTYGFSGTTPIPLPKKDTKKNASPAAFSAAPGPASGAKDYQAAFADLQSKYGFGGAPTPVPHSDSAPRPQSSRFSLSRFIPFLSRREADK